MTYTLTFRSDMGVDLIDYMGSDASFVAAARVSVIGLESDEPENAAEYTGLINYLVTHRHGTPFEHASMKFRLEVPIFVAREHMRHRMSSFNEMSGRYAVLSPTFHVPDLNRPLVNVGSSARPVMAPGNAEQHEALRRRMEATYGYAYSQYLMSLEDGVAKEVAREVLPVGIYTTYYWTANIRAVMHFLSLRTHDENAAFVSYPQYEIEQAAKQIEDEFAARFPITYRSFANNGRVAP